MHYDCYFRIVNKALTKAVSVGVSHSFTMTVANNSFTLIVTVGFVNHSLTMKVTLGLLAIHSL